MPRPLTYSQNSRAYKPTFLQSNKKKPHTSPCIKNSSREALKMLQARSVVELWTRYFHTVSWYQPVLGPGYWLGPPSAGGPLLVRCVLKGNHLQPSNHQRLLITSYNNIIYHEIVYFLNKTLLSNHKPKPCASQQDEIELKTLQLCVGSIMREFAYFHIVWINSACFSQYSKPYSGLYQWSGGLLLKSTLQFVMLTLMRIDWTTSLVLHVTGLRVNVSSPIHMLKHRIFLHCQISYWWKSTHFPIRIDNQIFSYYKKSKELKPYELKPLLFCVLGQWPFTLKFIDQVVVRNSDEILNINSRTSMAIVALTLRNAYLRSSFFNK